MYAKDEKQMLVTRMIITVIQPKKDWIYSTYSSLNYNLDCSAKFLTFLQYFYYYYFFIFLATTAVSFFLPFCFLFFCVCKNKRSVVINRALVFLFLLQQLSLFWQGFPVDVGT